MKWTRDGMVEYAKNEGYKFYPVSDKTTEKFSIICPVGHEYLVTFNNFRGGNRCKKCWENKRKEITHKYRQLKITPKTI